jgi:mannitol/fructose-specific phosphotransferase system IIA component (Ntr-type)
MLLTELVTPDRIRLPLSARDKRGVLRELSELLATSVGGDRDEIRAAVEERESVLSTGIGFGVAIPHGRAASVHELAVVCGVTAVPVPFDAVDGESVRLVFMIVGPESAAGQHVKVLSRIARLVRRESVRDALLAARDVAAFYAVLADAEAQ